MHIHWQPVKSCVTLKESEPVNRRLFLDYKLYNILDIPLPLILVQILPLVELPSPVQQFLQSGSLCRTSFDSVACSCRSSNKADGRWMLQPGSPESVSPDLDPLQCVNSFAGPLDPELSNPLLPVLGKGRSKGSLSFSDETTVYTLEKVVDSQVKVTAAYFESLMSCFKRQVPRVEWPLCVNL